MISRRFQVLWLAIAFSLTACAVSPDKRVVEPDVALIEARTSLPGRPLLDIGVHVFDAGLADIDASDDDVYPEVRKAEVHYIPFHLAQTLQRTGHWGAVRIVPDAAEEVDVLVHGEIVDSDGERLALRIAVVDVTGREWFDREYRGEADATAYEELQRGMRDPFQALYNAIANEAFAVLGDLDRMQLAEIRRVSELRYAAAIAPFAFEEFLEEDGGRHRLLRLPARGDPMVARIDRIRARERMFIDRVNDYYAQYYAGVWEPYLDWREAYRWQAENERTQVAASDTVMLAGGYEVYRSARGYAPDALIYTTAFSGLKASFGPKVGPLVTEVEGRTVELSGSYEEQFAQWRDILRRLFSAETGGSPDVN